MSATAFVSTQLQSWRGALEVRDGSMVQHAATVKTGAKRVLAFKAAYEISEKAAEEEIHNTLNRIAANDTVILELEAQSRAAMSSSEWMDENAAADPIR